MESLNVVSVSMLIIFGDESGMTDQQGANSGHDPVELRVDSILQKWFDKQERNSMAHVGRLKAL